MMFWFCLVGFVFGVFWAVKSFKPNTDKNDQLMGIFLCIMIGTFFWPFVSVLGAVHWLARKVHREVS